MRPNRSQTRSDLGRVIRAAEALGLTEYDFFRFAYKCWTGCEPDARMLENVFVTYMFQQTVPHWVRHLAREVNSRATEGRLNAVELEVMKYRKRQPLPRHGRLCLGAMAAAMVLYTFALTNISYDPQTSAPIPCYAGPGFKIFSEVAYFISGQEPSPCRSAKDR